MNTLLFTLEYPPFKGGIANYYENVVKYWPETDKIFVLNNVNPPDPLYERGLKAKIPPFVRGEWEVKNSDNLISKKLISEHGYPKWFSALYFLYKTIKAEKIDHILVGQILPLGTAAYYVTKITNTPYSVFLHGTDLSFALRTRRKKKMVLKILIKAKNIICSNNYTANILTSLSDFKSHLVTNKGANKIFIVTPGISKFQLPITNFQLKEKYYLSDKIVLFGIGRLVRRKGFDNVITAIPKILKAIPNLVYVIAGVGPDEEYLKKLARTINRQNLLIGDSAAAVIFLGEITDKEKWTWLNLCDIFITVSRNINGDFEGFGIVYLEAGLAGKPVIAGNSGGVNDAVINNVTGIIVEPESTDALAAAIVKLARDINLRNKLGQQARERVLKEFGWEDKIKNIYNFIHNK